MAATFQKYDAVLVDPEIASRMRLKQATTAVTNFGKVNQLNSLREAGDRLRGSERCDVVFLSYRFQMEEVINFIKGAKNTPQGQDAAYILVLGGKDQETSTVASSVMSGVDGFLFEPYSVDNLIEISAKVKKERARAREEAAMKLLISDIMNQIDLLAYLKQSKSEHGRTMKKLKDTCMVLSTLSPESFQVYQTLAIDAFENAPLPKRVFQRKQYSGASSRIKRKLEDKLLEELEKDSSTPKPE